jgi:phosphate transport system substrate-binding protein
MYLMNHTKETEDIYPFSDIILVARKPSADELATAQKFGFEYDVRPIARDGLVFLVHRTNKVDNLSLAQIRSIYLNEESAKNWKQFGGSGGDGFPGGYDGSICLYERERNSGSRELMDELVMTDEVLRKAITEEKEENIKTLRDNWDNIRRERQTPITSGGGGFGMGGAYFAVASDKDGISYSVNYYERFMIGVPQVRAIAVDGVRPNYETIRTKKYPLVSDVYVVTLKGIAEDSPAAKLRNWLLTEDGQRCIKESGYVPINDKIAVE